MCDSKNKLSENTGERHPGHQNGVGASIYSNQPAAGTSQAMGCANLAMQTRDLNFGAALYHLKAGRKVKRAKWRGHWFLSQNVEATETLPDMYQRGFKFSQLIVAVLADNGGCAPASPYQADILAEDWEIVG